MQEKDLSILAGLGFAGFFAGIVAMQILPVFFSVNFHSSVSHDDFVGFFRCIHFDRGFDAAGLVSQGFRRLSFALWSYIENYPFAFVLVTAFTTVNGLFLYLMRAPTALGRPIMDQLAGFRLYLQTAESDRLNLNAPEITADRFEALLPYAVALDVEKPWSEAFAAAVRRAHPDDSDPMAVISQGGAQAAGPAAISAMRFRLQLQA